MRRSSPHHTDVFSHLPALLMRELDTEPVAEVLDALVAAGWRPGQLRHRVGAAPAQGTVTQDAAALLELLRGLLAQTAPDVAHAREVEERERRRRREAEQTPPPASPGVRDASVRAIRAQLKGAPKRCGEQEPRTRPSCSLCASDSAYFVTREVHLCKRCVDVLATGQARLSDTA
jgi:hypothetical protein